MLELDHDQKLMEELWEAAEPKVELNDSSRRQFFAARGAAPLYHDNRRSFHRYFMRGKAVLRNGSKTTW